MKTYSVILIVVVAAFGLFYLGRATESQAVATASQGHSQTEFDSVKEKLKMAIVLYSPRQKK